MTASERWPALLGVGCSRRGVGGRLILGRWQTRAQWRHKFPSLLLY